VTEKTKLLVVDDDPRLLEGLELYLVEVGFEVITAGNGQEALGKMYHHRPDLVLLDVMMPQMDGWETCRRMRALTDVPIIMLTALGQEGDKVRGLNIGADDYVVKPFSLSELEARVRAVLRRARSEQPAETRAVYGDGELVVDYASLEVIREGKPVQLTARERQLLFLLAENAGRILPYSRILEAVWGPEYIGDVDYVKQYIWRLRQKVEPDPDQPRYILTKRGVGYGLAKQS